MLSRRIKAWTVLFAAVVMQSCLGGVYAWSVFCKPLQRDYGYHDGQTQLVFGTCIFVFTLSLLFTGRLQDRFGPRPLAIASGLFLAAGYLTASVGGSHFLTLWLGIGVLNGLAIGCGYVCPIATAVKWFPDHKGLVSGLAVAGYGASAIILMKLAQCLTARGWPVLSIFGLVGVVYGAIVVLSGLLLFLPGPIQRAEATAFKRRVLLRDRQFWWIFMAFFTTTFPGLVFLGNLRNICVKGFGNTEYLFGWALIVAAAGNSSGRVVWGFIYDHLHGRRSVLLSMTLTVLSMVAVILTGQRALGFLLAAFWVGFCYGGNFGIFAPEVARLWGAAVMGTVYPLALLSHGITAVVGPSLVGLSYDLTRSYYPGLIFAECVTMLGLGVLWLLDWHHKPALADDPVLPAPVRA